MSLGNLCRREVVVVNRGTTVKEAVKFMEEKNMGSIIVVGGGKPVGIVTDRDILLRIMNRGLDPEKTSVFHGTAFLHINHTLLSPSSLIVQQV
jgi:CBS domain-containing protein